MTCGFVSTQTAKVSRKRVQWWFGTLCSVQISAEDVDLANVALSRALDAFARASRLLNPYDPYSSLSVINQSAATGALEAPAALISVVEQALKMSALTQGRFDLTAWPLLQYWAQCAQEDRMPSVDALAYVLEAVDYRHVQLDVTRATIALAHPHARIDLSSLAKGYAMDSALAAALQYPVAEVRIDAGGQWLYWNAAQEPLDIAIAGLRNRFEIAGWVRIMNEGVATSSQAEARLIIQGKPSGHLYDMFTGMPVDRGRSSVSVIAPQACVADMLATALFVIGQDNTQALLQHFPEARAVWSDALSAR